MGFRIPDEKVQEIRERADILQVVGERVPLKKAGVRHTGLCPFHQEKTPSFTVHPGLGLFHCFGCGTGGDVISFLMKIEGRSFVEVATDLAARFGVQLPQREQSPEERDAELRQKRAREQMLAFNAQALELYHGLLLRDAGARHAREYLQSRGVTDEAVRRYKLGYAPDAWDVLAGHFTRNKADMMTVLRAGLVAQRDGSQGFYDRFRNRLLFPIFSATGEVLGFGGRQLADDGAAKYLNSPETPLFHKGKCLFGLNLAMPVARKEQNVLVVEGYFDQLALYEAGVQNVVATLGTALTDDHVFLLKRHVREVVVLFDGDEAGVRAAQKSADVLLRAGLTVRVIELPKGDDPDTFVAREGVEAFRARIKSARPIIEFVIDSSAARCENTPVAKAKCVEGMKSLFHHVTSPVERSLYVSRIADRLRIREDGVEAALGFKRAPAAQPQVGQGAHPFGGGRGFGDKRPFGDKRAFGQRGGERRFGARDESAFASALRFAAGQARADAREVLGSFDYSILSCVLVHPELAALAAADPSAFENPALHGLCVRVAGAYERDGTVELAAHLATLEDDVVRAQILRRTVDVQEAEAAEPQKALARAEKELRDVLRAQCERRWREEATELARRMAEASEQGDSALVTQLSQERMDLERKIRGRVAP